MKLPPPALDPDSPCSSANEGSEAEISYDESVSAAIVCRSDDGEFAWALAITDDLDRDGRLEVAACADAVRETSMAAAGIGDADTEGCDRAVLILSLEDDPAYKFAGQVAEECMRRQNAHYVSQLIDGFPPVENSDEARRLAEEQVGCAIFIEAIASS